MYLSRKLTPDSLEEIGTRFGRRHHSTVLHACDMIEREKHTDAALAETMAALEHTLEQCQQHVGKQC
jgi:chromosomal replication initiator protein